MAPMDKVHKVMSEFKAGGLRSGSASGPTVTSRKQAVAIGMSDQRKQRRAAFAAYQKGAR